MSTPRTHTLAFDHRTPENIVLDGHRLENITSWEAGLDLSSPEQRMDVTIRLKAVVSSLILPRPGGTDSCSCGRITITASGLDFRTSVAT